MLTSVPLSSLVPPKGNPRRSYDKKAIEGLAQSIKKDGLIHNLTVEPLSGGKYRVVTSRGPREGRGRERCVAQASPSHVRQQEGTRGRPSFLLQANV